MTQKEEETLKDQTKKLIALTVEVIIKILSILLIKRFKFMLLILCPVVLLGAYWFVKTGVLGV